MPRLSKIGAACLSAFGFGTGGANAVTADYLVVAGGGGGGGTTGGGGGAGGLLTGSFSLSLASTYTVIVGAGGSAGIQESVGGSGTSSSFGSLISTTGGGGGANNTTRNGVAGGSGGGGAQSNGGGNTSGGAGTSGQGYAGGGGFSGSYPNTCSGGGGGAGAVGQTVTSGTTGGSGGVGYSSSITGSATYYAGGGGGWGGSVSGSGGNGGGGTGSNQSSQPAGGAGTANLGGGGGGGPNSSTINGGQGGSGVVIIRYLGAQKFGGGIVSSDGTYTIHTFKTSGQLVPMTPITASYLIVAGGAGGGNRGQRGGGGGGAGGLLTGSTLSIDTSSTYIVTVGAGGTGAAAGTNTNGTSGTTSSLSLVSTIAASGGVGSAFGAGGTGASGGGGSGDGGSGGTVSPSGQGNAGGAGGFTSGSASASGGGGGAGAVGGAGNFSGSSGIGGAGGIGVASSISGTSAYYAGGGGGCGTRTDSTSGSSGAGGLGGGGNGSGSRDTGPAASSGTAGTGGGGGGADTQVAGNGGSGIVVISYAGTTQLMAGGTVTIVGGNVIHTFTSSGYLTPLTFVGRSLRFRGSASAYLSRTPANGGDRQKWTWSGWVKRGTLGTRQGWFSAGPTSGRGDTNTLQFGWQDTNGFQMGVETQYVLQSSQVFRDPAAWYHCVVAFDSTQASASNRVRLYVNGQEVTAWSTDNRSTYVTLNSSLGVNLSGNPTYIGTITPSLSFNDGYMADVRFIDGQALTPNSFGTFNSYGVWQPINYGGSYGNNGFYLPFNQNTTSTYAGVFSGSNYLTVGTTATNFLCTGSNSGITATFEAWVNPTAYSTGASAWMYSPVYSKGGTYYNFGVRNGQVRFYWYDGNPNSVDSPSTNDVPLNTWTHIAATLNGNTVKIYINGILKTTSTGFTGISAGGANTAEQIGYESGSNNTKFSGSISNLRVSTTVLYSGDFVPSVANLTSATATKLLTLQNSSIVDNSSNAYTITNVGSVTTASVTPFTNATTLVKDEGPQGNNWIPANISTTVGSTYDSMTDVPTLTSATAANYSVLNPLAKHPSNAYPTFSNANLTAANSGTDSIAYGTIGVTTGKFYWEHTIGTAGSIQIIGVSTCPDATYQRVIRTDTGQYLEYNGGSATWTTYGASSTTGDIIGVALDMTAQTIEFFKNGTSQGQKTSIGLTGLTIMPFVVLGSSAVCSYNFGQRPFAYTPPSGFVALNTYNL